jgi:hypothetical protein
VPGERFSVASVGVGVIAFVATTAAARQPFAGVAIQAQSVYAGDSYPSWGAGEPAVAYNGGDAVIARCDAAASFAFGSPVYYRQVASGSEQLGAIRQDGDSGDALYLPGWAATSPHFDTVINGTTYRLCEIARLG